MGEKKLSLPIYPYLAHNPLAEAAILWYDGKEIYTWNTTTSTNFSITSSAASTLQTRDSKLKANIEDDLTTFRLRISHKVYK